MYRDLRRNPSITGEFDRSRWYNAIGLAGGDHAPLSDGVAKYRAIKYRANNRNR